MDFKDDNGSIQHKKIISAYFGGDTRNFGERIRNKEIEYEREKRDLPILAGDLALVFYDHFDFLEHSENGHSKQI